MPRLPFVVGGEFVTDNLRPAPEVNAMRFYGGLATAISGVPDGAELVIAIENLAAVLDR